MNKLLKFQKEAIQFIDSNRSPVKIGYGIIGDECGLGKTIDAIMLSYIHLDEGSFLIVCTASMKLKWAREIKKWTREEAYIIYGEKSFPLPKAKFYIINYHILGKENSLDRQAETVHKNMFKKLERKRELACYANKEKFKKSKYKPFPIRLEGWIDELSKTDIIGIFPDEAHRLANVDAIWTKCFIKLFHTIKPKIFVPLSGTITRKQTRNLFTILNLTAPAIFNNKYRFLYRYCDPVKTPFGWNWDGSSNEEELHKLLNKVMIRRLKKDITGLPPRTFSVLPMELTKIESKNYSSASKEFKKIILEEEQNSLKIKNGYARLKQLAYLAKRNSVFNWIDEYLEDNDKLVIAAWHKTVISDLYTKYKEVCVKIDGSVSGKKRQLAEDRFQTDSKIKIIILQIEAGGEGLTLTASNAIAIIECPDTPGQLIQVSDRIHRIGQESDTVTIYFPFADGTIENKIADEIETSWESMETIMDGKKDGGLFKYGFK